MKLLIVEDEKDTISILSRGLSRNGYAIDIAVNGQKALEFLAINEYDLMLLDLDLPNIDGLTICEEAHRQRPALLIIILSFRKKINDIVSGLDHGADDYLTKPFHSQEILARIRALLRRDLRCREPQICIKDIIIDPVEHVVWKAGYRIQLTRKEFGILEYLMRHPGESVSQEELLEHVWGSNTNAFSNTIRVHIQTLRKKLADDSNDPQYIATVVGIGYRFTNNE
jgi:DNA-binding response OmpR family regulator